MGGSAWNIPRIPPGGGSGPVPTPPWVVEDAAKIKNGESRRSPASEIKSQGQLPPKALPKISLGSRAGVGRTVRRPRGIPMARKSRDLELSNRKQQEKTSGRARAEPRRGCTPRKLLLKANQGRKARLWWVLSQV